MKRESSGLIMTDIGREEGVLNRYRLIATMDAFSGREVFSVFLTTESADGVTEDFVYDITRDPDEARVFFQRIVESRATALHLREIAEDFLCEIVPI